jgi:ankyrin repeat protein
VHGSGWQASTPPSVSSRTEKLEQQQPSLAEQFQRAVRAGDVRTLRQLAPHRAELRDVVDAPAFAFNSPALVAVAGRGDIDLVDALLALGADPNRKSEWWAGGFHALYSARDGVADRLLAAGAIPDACAAAHLDRADLLEEMLAADRARAHERGGDGQTPLHFARSRRVVDLLLDAGADIDATDIDHRSTAAQWMLGDADNPRTSRLDLARYLVERGATADIFLAAALGLTSRARELIERDPSLLTLRTSQGEYGEKPPSSYHIYQWTIGPGLTPLHAAAHFGQRETLALLRAYAPPEQQLLLACHEGDRATALDLVDRHPHIVEQLTVADRRALTDEAWLANARAVTLMMELGFDPSVRSVSGPTGGTALHCAAWEGSPECVSAILAAERGRALVAVRDPTYGGTPLGWCCHGSRNSGRAGADHAAVARLLVEAGSPIDWDPSELDVPEGVREAIRQGTR